MKAKTLDILLTGLLKTPPINKKIMKKHPHATPVLIRAIIDNSVGNKNKLTEDDILAMKCYLRYNWNGRHPLDGGAFQDIVDMFPEVYHEWKDEMVQMSVDLLNKKEGIKPFNQK